MTRNLRIAYITHFASAATDQILRGMSQVMDESGVYERFTLREFEIGLHSKTLPLSLASWRPDVIVTLLDPQYRKLFVPFIDQGVPVISNANQTVGPYEPVVISDAMSLFSAVHEHFQQTKAGQVFQFCARDDATDRVLNQYQQFCQARGYPCHQFVLEEELDDVYFDNRPDRPVIPDPIRQWFASVPQPFAIFTQYSYFGPYLCRIARALGRSVPDDVAIIGADGFDVSLWCDPALTSTYIPFELVGNENARLALELISGRPYPNEPIVVGQVTVIPRGSTAGRSAQGVNIRAAIDFIARHACEGLRVQDVVDLTQSVSRQTFSKHFQQWTGQKPSDAIRLRKLTEAKRMLRDSDISITTLSRACGFCDDIEFRKVFSKAAGCSPSAYRKMNRTERATELRKRPR